ncbi:MAG: UDP-2,4-diacetamido-2,4,6-trideoxy-beta-L-altropyranose hydrolase [Terriglobales bacterium]
MAPGTLLVRADASVAMGTGHVMRCLALAQAWQDAGGDVLFAMAQSTRAMDARLRTEQIETISLEAAPGSGPDAIQVGKLAHSRNAEWVVVDGYQFDDRYQFSVKQAGQKLLFVDDIGHCAHYCADLLLNQNGHACDEVYRHRENYTRVLLGTRYAMLRREFTPWRRWRREFDPMGRRVLVTMGGSDPRNVTEQVIQALRLSNIGGLEARVLVGSSNPHFASLERAANQASGTVCLIKDARNIPELMAWADVAISAAGSTCWEMCLLGLPALLIDLAENQRPVAEELNRLGAAIHLGSTKDITSSKIAGKLQALIFSRELRTTMSERARELVDGEGAQRVVSAMRSESLGLRRATEKDCQLLWEWANDPEVRIVSFSTDPISWDRHLQWFNAKLADPNAVLYLAVDPEGTPIGHVRYQLEGLRAAVSISLAKPWRGKGLGRAILAKATQDLFQTTPATIIDAFVKPVNTISLQLFTRAGYKQVANETVSGQEAIHFILEKNDTSGLAVSGTGAVA